MMKTFEALQAKSANSQTYWESYLNCRVGTYEFRCIRYRAAAEKLLLCGLRNDDLVVDVGAGRCEFDHYLRTEAGWRGRYLPVDGSLDGTDLNAWAPGNLLRPAFFVAIEVLEHLNSPHRLMDVMEAAASKGIVATVPNPQTTDVLGMDPTHVTVIYQDDFTIRGWQAEAVSLFGKNEDSLIAVWQSSQENS